MEDPAKMPLQVSQRQQLVEFMKTPNGMELPEENDDDVFHPPANKKAKKSSKRKRYKQQITIFCTAILTRPFFDE